jgi:hypothetical protein
VHFLVSGIPASGKSTFCKWLEEKKRFLHLDVERTGVLERHGLARAWNTLFGAGAPAAPFLAALEKFRRPVAIDWGFPPEHLDAVRKLFAGGGMLWWFAADWAVARRKFKERGTFPVQLFDIQMRNIEAALPDIRTLFSSHLVYALPSTGIYTPPDEIWDSMLDTLAGPAGQTLGLPAHVHVRHSPDKK